jgi:hypothetical protein
LLEGEFGPGAHDLAWDGTDDRGRRVASGVYCYELRAGAASLRRSMVLLK